MSDRRPKARSNFIDSYKKKDSGIDRRTMRAHHRSVERKHSRDEEVNKRRQLVTPSLSPVKEAPKSKKVKETANERMQRLAKWKEERDLKKKLTSDNLKPTFKAGQAKKTNDFNSALKFSVLPKVNSKATKPSTVTSTRSSRAATKSAPKPQAAVPTKVLKPRSTNSAASTKSAPVQRKVAPKSAGKKEKSTVKSKPVSPKRISGQEDMQTNTPKTPFVTRRGDENSFAPKDSVFTAPENVASFTFKPLSPASASEFLFPNAQVSSPAARRCSSTPKISSLSSHPKVINSPGTSMIVETKESSAEDTDSHSDNERLVLSEIEVSASPDMRVRSMPRRGAAKKKSAPVKSASALTAAAKSAEPNYDSDKENCEPEPMTVASAEKAEAGGADAEQLLPTIAEDKDGEKSPTSDKPDEETMQEAAVVDSETVHDAGDAPVTGTPAASSNQRKSTASLSADRAPAPKVTFAPDFRTPQPSALKRRFRSEAPTVITPSGKSPWRKNDLRNSFILKGLSPEECVDILHDSPMVEMSRRPKKLTSVPAPALDLEEVEDIMNKSLATGGSIEDIVEELEKMETEEAAQESSEKTDAAATENKSIEQQDTPVEESKAEGEHDVPYYRNLLVTETIKLNEVSEKWNEINDSTKEIPEEVVGEIRTTVGQAQLLIAQRFKQFRGLVDDCEFKRGEKETTCTDLQGFWDMIYYQVEDVENKFAKLDKLRESNWKEEKPQKKKVLKKQPAAGKAGAKPSGKAPAARSKFADFRARMAAQKKEKEAPESVEMEVAAPEAPAVSATPHRLTVEAAAPEQETKTFCGGFFSVSSPVNKELKPHCQGGTPGRLSAPGSPALRSGPSSLHNTPVIPLHTLLTPTGSPIVKAVLERNARRSVSRKSLGYLLAPSLASPGGTPGRLNRSGANYRESLAFLPSPGLNQSPAARGSLLDDSLFSSDSLCATPQQKATDTPMSARRSGRKSVRLMDLPEQPKEVLATIADAPAAVQVGETYSPLRASKRRSLAATSERRGQRMSKRRSVHFAVNTAAAEQYNGLPAPVTPFNKDSLVARSRQSSTSRSNEEEHNLSFPLPDAEISQLSASVAESPANMFSKLTMQTLTPSRKSKRISGSGFTPPSGSAVPSLDSLSETVDNLMCFSPTATTPSTRSRRKSRKSISLI